MNSNNLENYEQTFKAKVHFWGRLSIAIAFFTSLSIPFYLTFIAGYAVNSSVLIEGLIFVVGFVGILYLIEPVSYFPVLGAIGTYMSFLSGNIGNMRMPVVGAVQNALQVEAGCKKAEIAAVFGLVSSNIVNLAILLLVIMCGTAIINALPASMLSAFSYAVPGIIGAMIYTFGAKMSMKHIVITIILGLLSLEAINYIGILWPAIGKPLSIGKVGVAALVAIAFSLILARKNNNTAHNLEPEVEK